MIRVESFDRPVAVVGDIHGRSDLLAALRDQLPDGMPLLVLGDLCDRGPDSKGVIDRLIRYGAIGVFGNHEQWLLDWVNGHGFDHFALSAAMGGEATLTSYGVRSRVPREIHTQRDVVPPEHVEWLNQLSLVMDLTVEDESYWLIHAGLPVARNLRGLTLREIVPYLAAKHPMDLLWPANDPARVPECDRTVIMGHMPRKEPYDGGHIIAVDTGSGTIRGGRLTAVILPERRFVSVG